MKYKVIDNYRLESYGIREGDICIRVMKCGYAEDMYYNKNWKDDGCWFIKDDCLEELETNRQILNNFLKERNINKSQASLMLGKSRCWLATMTYDSKRDDIKQKSLDRIIAALSIDWKSTNRVQVSTKGYVPYTTAPCGYKRPQDKARLMQAYFNGEVK